MHLYHIHYRNWCSLYLWFLLHFCLSRSLWLAGKPSVSLDCPVHSDLCELSNTGVCSSLKCWRFLKNLMELEKEAGRDVPGKDVWAALEGAAPHSCRASHPDLNSSSVCLGYKQGNLSAVCPCPCRHVFRSLSLFVRAIWLFIWGQHWTVATTHVTALVGVYIHTDIYTYTHIPIHIYR